MFYLDLETPKVSHKRTLPLRQVNNNTSKETISPPRQASSAKKNLQNQNDSLSFCFSSHCGLSLLLSTQPGTKLNYLEALKAFKGNVFFYLSFRELFLSTVQTVSGGEETMEMSRLATAMRYDVQTGRKVKIST